MTKRIPALMAILLLAGCQSQTVKEIGNAPSMSPIGSGLRYNGATQASGIDRSIPGYTLIDALIRYEVKENFDISLNATNLLDKDYASCEFSSCHYGDGREITLTARHRW